MWKMSGVLQFYDLVSTGNGSSNASVTGRCRECGKTIKGFRNITSNFVTHLRNVHKQVYEAYDSIRPHKGSRKRRSLTNAYDADGAANSADDSAMHNREMDKSRNTAAEDDSTTEKRLRNDFEADKRMRKAVVKTETTTVGLDASSSSQVNCRLADCVAPRCDAAHAAVMRFCISVNEPVSFVNSASFRSLLHTSFASVVNAGASPLMETACATCASLNDLLAATYLRTRAKLRSLVCEGDTQLNIALDVVGLPRTTRDRDRELLVCATLNFVPTGNTSSDTFLYTTAVVFARVASNERAVSAFARSFRDRLLHLASQDHKVSQRVRRLASVSCELDSLEAIVRDRNVSLLHGEEYDLPSRTVDEFEAFRQQIAHVFATANPNMDGDVNITPCADLTVLRCFQSRVERALNEAIRMTMRNSEPFRELRRNVAILRGALDRAHHAAVSLLHSIQNAASPARSNGMMPVRSNGEPDSDRRVLDSASPFAEAELRAFVGWLKTLRALDSMSARRWNAEMKTLRRLLDIDASKAALLRHVADVDLEWLVDPAKRPDAAWSASASSTLREFVSVVQPFEEVLDVFDASSQISISLAVPCLFGFDSHLNEMAATVQAELNRALVRQIRVNLHAEFAFVFNALDGDRSALEPSERRVVETLLCGTLLDPRFKVTCFDETAAHKLVAVNALRSMLVERHLHIGESTARMDREIDEYLEEDIIAQVNDPLRVLEYWKANARRWPSLYRLANEVLAVPATRTPFQRLLGDLLSGGFTRNDSGKLSNGGHGGDEVLAIEAALSLVDRIGDVDWISVNADQDETDLQFSEAKRFALKCNLDLLDHAKFFSA